MREVADDADRFVFAHALVRETLYESPERVPARAPAPPDRAGAGGPRPARPRPPSSPTTTSRAATWTARARPSTTASRPRSPRPQALAYEEAKAHYAAALERLHNNAPRRCELLIGLGTAAARMSDPDAATPSWTRRRSPPARTSPELLARAALGRFGNYAHAGAVDHEAIELLETRARGARATTRARSSRSCSRAWPTRCTSPASRSASMQLTARALELARRGGDPLALVTALESRHTALLLSAEALDERLRDRDRALRARRAHRRARADGARAALAHSATCSRWATWTPRAPRGGTPARARGRAAASPSTATARARWEVIWAMIGDRLDEVAGPDRARPRARRPRAPPRGRRRVRRPARGARLPHGALGDLAHAARRADREQPAARRQPARRSRSPTCRPATAKPRPRSSSGSPPTTSPRSRATCCGWARWPCSPRCARCSATASAPASLYDLLLPHRDRNVVIGIAACWGSAERFLGLLADDPARLRAAAHFETAIARNAAASTRCSRWPAPSTPTCWRPGRAGTRRGHQGRLRDRGDTTRDALGSFPMVVRASQTAICIA